MDGFGYGEHRVSATFSGHARATLGLTRPGAAASAARQQADAQPAGDGHLRCPIMTVFSEFTSRPLSGFMYTIGFGSIGLLLHIFTSIVSISASFAPRWPPQPDRERPVRGHRTMRRSEVAGLGGG